MIVLIWIISIFNMCLMGLMMIMIMMMMISMFVTTMFTATAVAIWMSSVAIATMTAAATIVMTMIMIWVIAANLLWATTELELLIYLDAIFQSSITTARFTYAWDATAADGLGGGIVKKHR
jgi:hypothetical protein